LDGSHRPGLMACNIDTSGRSGNFTVMFSPGGWEQLRESAMATVTKYGGRIGSESQAERRFAALFAGSQLEQSQQCIAELEGDDFVRQAFGSPTSATTKKCQ
jgi:hypothetical protein